MSESQPLPEDSLSRHGLQPAQEVEMYVLRNGNRPHTMTYLPPEFQPVLPQENHDLSQSSAFQSEYLLLRLQTLTESSHARLYSLSYPDPYAGLLPVESASLPDPLPAAFPCGIHQYKVNHRTDKF